MARWKLSVEAGGICKERYGNGSEVMAVRSTAVILREARASWYGVWKALAFLGAAALST